MSVVAARNTGRNWIAFDVSPVAIEVTQRRLAQEVLR